MCWIAIKEEDRELHVATKDIKVKKVLEVDHYDGYCSPCYPMRWEKGRDYKTHFVKYGNLCIDNGFHSCKEIHTIPTQTVGKNKRGYWVCTDYSKTRNYRKPMFHVRENHVLCDFVIPKGARYYLNHYGEYVSDRIRFVGVSDETKEMKHEK